MNFRESLLVVLLAGAAPLPLHAQQAPPPEGPAQPDPDEELFDDEEFTGEEIVVTGQRLRGAVAGDIPPEVQLGARDIRAYGAGSLAELLTALGPQTRSGAGRGGGRPVILLNGRRISSFSEIRDLPPEAVERVDILPEEVALKYGYRADQRVVNFVLRPRFRAVTAEVAGGMATAGGRGSYEADLNVLRIISNGRWNLDAEVRRDAALFESERDLMQVRPADAANTTDLGRFRTLLPETDRLSLAGTVNRTILDDVSATLNARYDQTLSKSRFGLPSVALSDPDRPFDQLRPLTRDSNNRTAHLGMSLNGDMLPWRWSLTANYDRANNRNLSDTNPDPADVQAGILSRGRERSLALTQSADAELVASGPLLRLPAGEIATSLKLGLDTRSLHSESNRGGTDLVRDLSRNRVNGQANIDVPIASRRNEVLSAIGDLSANANAAVEHLSDFGTLRVLGAGLNWSPIREVRILASLTDEDGAPTIQQLGDPVILVPNVRVFDFTRGQTVDISRLEGGNPDLSADNRRVLKLSMNVRPLEEADLSISANYVNSTLHNLIASFPTATPEIEGAFPDRFVRDAQGGLLRIDSRPINFERADRQELRWGLNFSKPLSQRAGGPGGPGGAGGPGGWRGRAAEAGAGGAPAPGRPAAAEGRAPDRASGASQTGGRQGTPPDAAQGPPPAGSAPGVPPAGQAQATQGAGGAGPQGSGRGFGRGGFGAFGGGGPQGGRMQFSLYHTLHIENEILIRQGVPVLDLLNGSATGNRGGQPRHQIEAQAGLFRNGLGARLTGNWQSGTTVRGVPDGSGGSTGDLRFDDFGTINLRLFADLGQQRSLVRQHRWLRGTRVSLVVDNLLDSRIDVRDESGATPLSYQGAYLDPLGRSVRLSLRKLFF